MKKILCYLLVLSMLAVSCVGCKKNDTDKTSNTKVETSKGSKEDSNNKSEELEESNLQEENESIEESVTQEKTESQDDTDSGTDSEKKTSSSNNQSSKKEQHTHSYSTTVTNATCTEQGFTTYICSCGNTYNSDYVSANGHTEVVDCAVAATTTSTGLTEGKHCSACGTVLIAQQTTPIIELSPAERSSLKVVGSGQDYTLWYKISNTYNICRINSVDYSISSRNDNTISIDIDILTSLIEQNSYNSYIAVSVELLNESGVCVHNGVVCMSVTHLNQTYSYNLYLPKLAPGNYTLVFGDYNI